MTTLYHSQVLTFELELTVCLIALYIPALSINKTPVLQSISFTFYWQNAPSDNYLKKNFSDSVLWIISQLYVHYRAFRSLGRIHRLSVKRACIYDRLCYSSSSMEEEMKFYSRHASRLTLSRYYINVTSARENRLVVVQHVFYITTVHNNRNKDCGIYRFLTWNW